MNTNETLDTQTSPLILVADDEYYAQMLLKRVFEREGYRVETADDGVKAIERARVLHPDLILMDIQMPGIDGFEAVKLLREDSSTESIPIIVVTAAARDPQDVARGLGLGADDYQRKPFNTSELVARVRNKIRAYHLEERLKQRTEELEALVRIGSILNEELALDELADRILDATRERLPSASALLIILNPQRQPSLVRSRGWHSAEPQSDALSRPDTLPGHVLDSGEAMLVASAGEAKKVPRIFDDGPCVSGIAAPFKHHGQILGVLALGDGAPGHFSEGHLRVLRSIAEQAALAIRNAQLYTELRGYADGLESMVEARTAALQSAQAQLVRAEKLAALGTLAAGVAHEVNNPLQAIQTNLEMALEDLDEQRPVDRELLDFAKQDVQRIEGIVSRLLDFARPAQVELKAVNLNELVREVLTLAGKQLEHAHVKVQTALTARRAVLGSADQLKQVILNLVVNAMEAMPNGGELTIHTEDASDAVILKVRDTGTGIQADELPKVFDPFFTTKPDGTGLGLSVTYSIIEGHGGQIEVRSEPGVFTEFTVCLPVAERK
jgi:two-component system NtrC family sensor kinase